MKTSLFRLADLFDLTAGEYHATSELDKGATPLVSCGWENNGVIGYYDIPRQYRYSRALTVAFNGAPLTTHFHPYEFGAKDDVAVLQPKGELEDSLLIYAAALLNRKVWRYSYGRKCYRDKLQNVSIELPVTEDGLALDATLPRLLLEAAHGRVKAAAMASVEALLSSAVDLSVPSAFDDESGSGEELIEGEELGVG